MSWLLISTRALIATKRNHGDTVCICIIEPHQHRERPTHRVGRSRVYPTRVGRVGTARTARSRCGDSEVPVTARWTARLTSLARKAYDEGMSEFLTDTNEFTLNGVTYVATPVRTALGTHRGRFMIRCNGEVIGEIRSEEHTSELQSRENLVCRLLLEKRKMKV